MASRAGRQRTARCAHVGYIVKKLVSKLSTPEHQKRMVTTSRLLPVGSLKRRCLRNLFNGWVNRKFKGEGRILTKKVASNVVRLLRSQLELPPCHDLSEEISRMHYFLKTARKRLSGKVKPKMANLDEMETLPLCLGDPTDALEQDEWWCPEDWIFNFFDVVGRVFSHQVQMNILSLSLSLCFSLLPWISHVAGTCPSYSSNDTFAAWLRRTMASAAMILRMLNWMLWLLRVQELRSY